MQVNQVYNIVNSLAGQLFGSTAVAVTDTTGLRALGQSVASAAGYDKFLSLLVDRIGKTIIRTLDSEIEFPGLLRNDFSMGAMLQKITVSLPDSIENDAWNISSPGFTPTNFDVHLPSATVTYFAGTATWKVQQTIPDEPMLNSAFDSAEAMGAFISGIIDAMTKAINEQINAVSKATIASLAVEKADNSSATVVDLLTPYNTLAGTSLTAGDAIYDKGFLRYAAQQIKRYIAYMDTPSVLYNEGDGNGNAVLRRTKRDNMHVWLLHDFWDGVNTYAQSDTFHNELTSLPYFKDVKMWQGSGTTPATFADCSTIHAKAQNGDDVEMTYVIGMLADREAIGIGKFQIKTSSQRNDIDDYTNMATKCNIMHYVDTSENAVVFVLAAPTITP